MRRRKVKGRTGRVKGHSGHRSCSDQPGGRDSRRGDEKEIEAPRGFSTGVKARLDEETPHEDVEVDLCAWGSQCGDVSDVKEAETDAAD